MAHCWDSISVQNYSHSWDCNSTVDKYISLWVWVPTQKQKSPSLDLRSQMKCQQVICVCFYVEWDRECACVRACVHACVCVCEREWEWVSDMFCLHVHALHVCSAKEARRGCWIPWDWSYRPWWPAVLVVGSKHRFSGRAASYFNHWALIPAPKASVL